MTHTLSIQQLQIIIIHTYTKEQGCSLALAYRFMQLTDIKNKSFKILSYLIMLHLIIKI